MSQEENFLITNKTKGKLQSLPFSEMKEKVLGKKYSLSLTFVSDKMIHALNYKYRKINRPTDILSFPLSRDEGDIFICPKMAKIKSKEFKRTEKNFIGYLFIHGLVHLLGHDHGQKMEAVENKYRKHFHI